METMVVVVIMFDVLPVVETLPSLILIGGESSPHRLFMEHCLSGATNQKRWLGTPAAFLAEVRILGLVSFQLHQKLLPQ